MTEVIEEHVLFMDKKQVSKYVTGKGLPLSVKTLDKYITSGGGPVFHKYKKFVRYTLPEVDMWIEQQISAPYQSSSQVPAN